MKYINFKRYKFSTAIKNFKTLTNSFLKIFKILNLSKYDFRKIYKYIDIKKLDFKKITKYLNFRSYNLNLIKHIKLFNSKIWTIHIPSAIFFFSFLYLLIPTFFNYDKSHIEKFICKNKKIECYIKGKVNYSLFPSPRIKIKNLIIKEATDSKVNLLTVEKVSIKLSIKNLLAREKHKFKKVLLNNYEANINLNKFKNYENFFSKETNFIPLIFNKGKILFYNKKNYVGTISDARIKVKYLENLVEAKLEGKFLNDDITIKFENKNIDNEKLTDITLKMKNSNFLSNLNFSDLKKDKNKKRGNFLIRKDKNKITGIFDYDYKGNKLLINKSNIRNTFLDGKLVGEIILKPFFDFDLELNLNSINFTRLYSYFLFLDEPQQKKLFNINKKINGKLYFTADKVYSKHNLVKSIESRFKFYNGNIKVEQLLFNLGKLGAADLLGTLTNDKESSNFKFESNIFIDNEKKFLSKFGIYGKDKLSSNLFIAANLNIKNISFNINEISEKEKLNIEDINYIESEFNDIMLSNGFNYLFDFQKLKVFLKSISSEEN